MPRDLFKEAGITQAEIDQFKAKSGPRDLFAEAGITPEEIKQYKEQNSGTVNKIISSLANNPATDTAYSLGAGANMAMHEATSGIYNLIARIAHGKTIDAPEMLPNKYPSLAKASQFATNLAMPIPGVNKFKAAAEGGNALVKALASLGDAGATGAGYGMLYGANDKDKSLLKSGTEGAFFGSVLHALLGGAANTLPFLKNKMTKKTLSKVAPGRVLSPEQTEKAYESVRPLLDESGAKIDFGSLVGDKRLSREYNQDISGPFASKKIEDNQDKLVAVANNEAQDIINKISGGKGGANNLEKIKKEITAMHEGNAKKSSENFDSVLNAAEKEGIPFKNEEAASYAKKILDREEGTIASPLDDNSALRKALNVIGNDNINPKSSYNNTAKKAHFSHSNIGNLASKLAARGDNSAAKIAYGLQESLAKDIENSLSGTKHYDKWQEARKFHKNNVVPFQDTAIQNILKGSGKDLRFLPNELIKDKNKGIYDKLGQDSKNMIAMEKFKTALNDDGVSESTDINRLVNEYKKLKRDGKHTLLDEETRGRVERLGMLNKMLGEAKIAVNTPATGARNKKKIDELNLATKLLAAGYVNPLIPIVGYGARTLKNTAREKSLTSNALRDAYIKGGFKYKDPSKKTTALTRALAAAMNSGDNNAN